MRSFTSVVSLLAVGAPHDLSAGSCYFVLSFCLVWSPARGAAVCCFFGVFFHFILSLSLASQFLRQENRNSMKKKGQLSRSIKMPLETCTSLRQERKKTERGNKCHARGEKEEAIHSFAPVCYRGKGTGKRKKEDKRITKRSKNVLKLSRLQRKHKEQPEYEDEDGRRRNGGKERENEKRKNTLRFILLLPAFRSLCCL